MRKRATRKGRGHYNAQKTNATHHEKKIYREGVKFAKAPYRYYEAPGRLKIMIKFKLENDEFIELNHLLKVTRLCDSGGSANTAIAGGQVKVDGNTELRKRRKIRAGQVVEFENQKIIVKGVREPKGPGLAV